MIRGIPCHHCRVPTPARELTRGYCPVCFADEAEDLPPHEAEAIERGAIYRARKGGIRAFGRVCGHEKCSCARLRKDPPPAIAANRREVPVFNDEDDKDLHIYFGAPSSGYQDLQIANTKRSRLKPANNKTEDSGKDDWWLTSETPNRTEPRCPICWKFIVPGHVHTKKRRKEWADRPMRVYDTEVNGQLIQVKVYAPTQDPDTRECELIESCHQSNSYDVRVAEIDMINEVGGRDRKARVHRVLSRVPQNHADVLEARYAPNQELSASNDTLGIYASIALLTDSLHVERGESSEAPRSVLAKLTHDSADPQMSQVKRSEIKAKLQKIRNECLAMLFAAQQSYAKVAWEIGL